MNAFFFPYVTLVVFLFFTPPACVVFNDCSDEVSVVIANLSSPLDLRKALLRTGPAKVGNLVADSLFWAVFTYGSEEPDIALINAGAIRQEVGCKKESVLRKGPIHLSLLRDMLPFDNHVVLARLSGDDIRLLLEHAVEGFETGHPPNEMPHFLHISGLRFDVDCSRKPQKISPDGLKIIDLGDRIRNLQLVKEGSLIPLESHRIYNVATTDFIAMGNDGFLAFLNKDPHAIKAHQAYFEPIQDRKGFGLHYGEAVSQYMEEKSRDGEVLEPSPFARIKLSANCGVQ